MKRQLYLCLTVIALLFPAIGTSLNSEDIANTIEKNSIKEINLLMPVNVATAKLNLSIRIPKDFKMLKNPNSDLMEFIPKTDKDDYVWSEIITVKHFAGQKLKAKQIVDFMVAGMEKSAKNLKVLQKTSNDLKNHAEASALILYSTPTRQELLKLYAASGPYDAVLVQDAVPVKSDKDLAKARKKLEQFFKNNVSFINGKNVE